MASAAGARVMVLRSVAYNLRRSFCPHRHAAFSIGLQLPSSISPNAIRYLKREGSDAACRSAR